MCCQCRVSKTPGMRKPTLCWSLSGSMWISCYMLCCKSCSLMWMWSKLHRRCFYSLPPSNNFSSTNWSHRSLQPIPMWGKCKCPNRNRAGACQCIPEYLGDPYVACQPEYTINADCPSSLACQNLHCVDPCPVVCGVNAKCRVVKYNPTCTCNPVIYEDSCVPNSCVPNAECRERQNHSPLCKCDPGFIGDPFSALCTCLPGLQGNPCIECKPERSINPDCPLNLVCIRNKCKGPCPGVWGVHARCSVQNHSTLCKFDSGFIGDPFSACYPPPTTPPPPEPTVSDPCDPNPCGLNALARPSDDRCIFSCPPGLQGDPYVQCKPEQCAPTAVCRVNNHRADCVVDEECPQVLACRNKKCVVVKMLSVQ